MKQYSWKDIVNLAEQKATLHTKTGAPFTIFKTSEATLSIKIRSGEEYTISRANLEKATTKIQAGTILRGPKDYRDLIADDRPAYAWAILKHLSYLN